MNKFDRATRKYYYDDAHLSECSARVVKIGGDYIELDETVAYPEGGGQESDHGVIVSLEGFEIRFVHVRKMYTTRVHIPDMPDIGVDGVIEHVVHDDDKGLLEKLRLGMPVVVRIDVMRRARLSLSHTASHLVYLGVSEVRPDAVAGTLGCHIRSDAARFDFAVSSRFLPDELAEIERLANAFVTRNSRIHMYAHAEYRDARYWECEGRVIPCGGTHIDSTTPIGSISVRRKSMGSGKERIACEFAQAMPEIDAFHV
ncbi:hypothetical protein ACFFJT_15500 [Dyella flava]|uniref:Alanyl-tRNA editing protein n=1 Tax=Dyella flava TaxID=1920170 RepID=A0ABS2K2N2_9GAMM|nr:alanyl-tRNA editing protein [Dyella flava]MBM7125493.1 alanyl-tRNA editing protein [Dyella flava]GLQ51646.1 synthetase [Dyella flava]